MFAVRGGSQARTVELSQMPRQLIDAVLAMEDRRFFEHAGFDLGGVARAAFANLAAGGAVQGGSTITQQLAKNLFLTPERSLARKLQEVMLAIWLERRLTKEEILARYLNTVYLGAGAYGVDAASQRYFGQPVEQLSLAEAAMLAGLIQAPSRFAPTRSLEEAQERARIVLDAMVDFGAIDAAAARAAKAQPAELSPPPVEQPAYGYAADFAADRGARHARAGRRQLRRRDHDRAASAAARRAHDQPSGSGAKATPSARSRRRWSRWRPMAPFWP